jgi:hypothetical protein
MPIISEANLCTTDPSSACPLHIGPAPRAHRPSGVKRQSSVSGPHPRLTGPAERGENPAYRARTPGPQAQRSEATIQRIGPAPRTSRPRGQRARRQIPDAPTHTKACSDGSARLSATTVESEVRDPANVRRRGHKHSPAGPTQADLGSLHHHSVCRPAVSQQGPSRGRAIE